MPALFASKERTALTYIPHLFLHTLPNFFKGGVSTSLSYPLYVVVDHLSPTDDLSSRNVLNMDSLL
ncbi:MAG: hypothetical protein LWW97_10215, partial [Deltaproteobacteria bacterium]|nr:hypothetical protein [Deltaproteobacteria bacterium]